MGKYLNIITPDEFNSIKNLNQDEINNLKNKLNQIENNKEKTDAKTLFIDFENNSPYQVNFIYFCQNYLSYKDSITTIVIINIGK